jgi:hypothetical protein
LALKPFAALTASRKRGAIILVSPAFAKCRSSPTERAGPASQNTTESITFERFAAAKQILIHFRLSASRQTNKSSDYVMVQRSNPEPPGNPNPNCLTLCKQPVSFPRR